MIHNLLIGDFSIEPLTPILLRSFYQCSLYDAIIRIRTDYVIGNTMNNSLNCIDTIYV